MSGFVTYGGGFRPPPCPSQNLIRAHEDANVDLDGSRGADELEVSTQILPRAPLKNCNTSTDRYRAPRGKGEIEKIAGFALNKQNRELAHDPAPI
jgi:hypothetical protein